MVVSHCVALTLRRMGVWTFNNHCVNYSNEYLVLPCFVEIFSVGEIKGIKLKTLSWTNSIEK